MKVYNSPAQSRSLREIEAAAASPVTNVIQSIHGTVQPAQLIGEGKEKGAEAETKAQAKKARSKKNTKKV